MDRGVREAGFQSRSSSRLRSSQHRRPALPSTAAAAMASLRTTSSPAWAGTRSCPVSIRLASIKRETYAEGSAAASHWQSHACWSWLGSVSVQGQSRISSVNSTSGSGPGLGSIRLPYDREHELRPSEAVRHGGPEIHSCAGRRDVGGAPAASRLLRCQ